MSFVRLNDVATDLWDQMARDSNMAEKLFYEDWVILYLEQPMIDVVDWAKEHLDHPYWYSSSLHTWAFKEPSDSTLFTLRWM